MKLNWYYVLFDIRLNVDLLRDHLELLTGEDDIFWVYFSVNSKKSGCWALSIIIYLNTFPSREKCNIISGRMCPDRDILKLNTQRNNNNNCRVFIRNISELLNLIKLNILFAIPMRGHHLRILNAIFFLEKFRHHQMELTSIE